MSGPLDFMSYQNSTPQLNVSSPQQILCVCCSEYNEWDRENVVMTGSADGVVRMWSIDYVEVPVGGEEQENGVSCTCEPIMLKKRVLHWQ